MKSTTKPVYLVLFGKDDQIVDSIREDDKGKDARVLRNDVMYIKRATQNGMIVHAKGELLYLTLEGTPTFDITLKYGG